MLDETAGMCNNVGPTSASRRSFDVPPLRLEPMDDDTVIAKGTIDYRIDWRDDPRESVLLRPSASADLQAVADLYANGHHVAVGRALWGPMCAAHVATALPEATVANVLRDALRRHLVYDCDLAEVRHARVTSDRTGAYVQAVGLRLKRRSPASGEPDLLDAYPVALRPSFVGDPNVDTQTVPDWAHNNILRKLRKRTVQLM